MLWLAGGAATYRLAAGYANRAIDASLLQASRALARQLKPLGNGLLIDFPELEARLRALLRRTQPAAATADIEIGRLSFARDTHRATVEGTALDLSPREWTLLELLVTQRDRVVTKEQIAQVWSSDGGELGSGNSTEVYIHRLRRKLEGAALTIRTVRGLGYLLEADPAVGTA